MTQHLNRDPRNDLDRFLLRVSLQLSLWCCLTFSCAVAISEDAPANRPLSVAEARLIVERNGDGDGLEVVAAELTEDSAEVVAEYEGSVHLVLGDLSKAVAERLATHSGRMSLVITRDLPDSVCEAFDNYSGPVSITTPHTRIIKSSTGNTSAQSGSKTPTSSAQRPVAAQAVTDATSVMASFEAECDRVCAAMTAGYRAASNSPRDIVTSCGDKLEEMGANPDKRMDGKGISAGCARATITYFGMYSLLLMEAGVRCVGQEVPDGGLVAMFDSMLTDADKSLGESGDAAKYWTHVAFIRSLIQLNAESNAFHEDFKRQLMEGGARPVVFVELQRMRRDIRDLLVQRYSASVEAGIKRYGPTSVPAN
jgi:hypothetical protein